MAVPNQSQSTLRHGLACLHCRQRKRKCDGTRPTCAACGAAGRVCQYAEVPKSRLQVLEERIHELESTIQQLDSTHTDTHGELGSANDERSLAIASNPPVASTSGLTSFSSQPSKSLYRLQTRAPSEKLDGVDELPPRMVMFLINRFIENRGALPMEFHVPRFLSSLSLPATDPKSPHPALLDAMCLMACYFERGFFHQYEEYFLTRFRKSMQDSLAFADRLMDFVKASLIVSMWHFFKTPLVPVAHNQTASTVRFAMGCGLHKLDVNTAQDSGGAMVSPPEDAIEFEDRLNIFWGVYSLDCLSALFASVPSALPAEEDITTCWPLSWQFYEQTPASRSSIRDLFACNKRVCNAATDSLVTLVCKGTAFFYRAARFAWFEFNPNVPPSATFPGVFLFDHALSEYANSLPPLNVGKDTVADMQLATAHTLVYTSVILLHGLLIACNPRSVELCRNAISRVIESARAMILFNNTIICHYSMLAWDVSRSYLQGIRKAPHLDTNLSSAKINEYIDVLSQAMDVLREYYPADFPSSPSVDVSHLYLGSSNALGQLANSQEGLRSSSASSSSKSRTR